MTGERFYLIRYGTMGHVGRFPAPEHTQTSFPRGQAVVVQTDRGVELGEVLTGVEVAAASPAHAHAPGPHDETTVDGSPGPQTDVRQRIMRAAGPDDLASAMRSSQSRSERFTTCERILADENWPWPVIDVEPLLDGQTTVIHYIGPADADVTALRARFRAELDLDVTLEAVGAEPDDEPNALADAEKSGGGCGSCGSSNGGGGGTAKAESHDGHGHDHTGNGASGCSTSSSKGCASCGISQMLAERRRVPV
jgi:hypothetical protein